MSTLLLGRRRAVVYFAEDDQHLFFPPPRPRFSDRRDSSMARPSLTASSTQDIAIAFSYRQKTFIHVIDQYLDNERSKVVDDLDFTGCVDHVGLIPRRWVPQDAYNSTGDRLRTDGEAAVLFLHQCAAPRIAQALRLSVPDSWSAATQHRPQHQKPAIPREHCVSGHFRRHANTPLPGHTRGTPGGRRSLANERCVRDNVSSGRGVAEAFAAPASLGCCK